MKLLDFLHLPDAVNIQNLDPGRGGGLDGGAELGSGAVDHGVLGVPDQGEVPLVPHVELRPQVADMVHHLRQRVGANI